MHPAVAAVYSLWKRVETTLLDRVAPIVDLVARVYIAKVFFSSGWNKISDWETTLYLFQEEYHVPLLPPEVAASVATAGELGLSALLVIGLFTRFSASGLLVLNIVAVISYYAALKDSPVALQDHLEWGILLALIMATQVRQLTLDHLIARYTGGEFIRQR
jgi:putative oxidoreductase